MNFSVNKMLVALLVFTWPISSALAFDQSLDQGNFVPNWGLQNNTLAPLPTLNVEGSPLTIDGLTPINYWINSGMAASKSRSADLSIALQRSLRLADIRLETLDNRISIGNGEFPQPEPWHNALQLVDIRQETLNGWIVSTFEGFKHQYP